MEKLHSNHNFADPTEEKFLLEQRLRDDHQRPKENEERHPLQHGGDFRMTQEACKGPGKDQDDQCQQCARHRGHDKRLVRRLTPIGARLHQGRAEAKAREKVRGREDDARGSNDAEAHRIKNARQQDRGHDGNTTQSDRGRPHRQGPAEGLGFEIRGAFPDRRCFVVSLYVHQFEPSFLAAACHATDGS